MAWLAWRSGRDRCSLLGHSGNGWKARCPRLNDEELKTDIFADRYGVYPTKLRDPFRSYLPGCVVVGRKDTLLFVLVRRCKGREDLPVYMGRVEFGAAHGSRTHDPIITNLLLVQTRLKSSFIFNKLYSYKQLTSELTQNRHKSTKAENKYFTHIASLSMSSSNKGNSR